MSTSWKYEDQYARHLHKAMLVGERCEERSSAHIWNTHSDFRNGCVRGGAAELCRCIYHRSESRGLAKGSVEWIVRVADHCDGPASPLYIPEHQLACRNDSILSLEAELQAARQRGMASLI